MPTQAITRKKAVHRFSEFDLLKAFAVLGLPAVHLIEESLAWGFGSAGLHGLEVLIVGLSIVGPSVFMICMGFALGGTRTSPASSLRQGLRFLALGAILNLMRWILPGIMHFLATTDPLLDDFEYSLMSDIYYFVGFFHIFYALIRKLKLSTVGLIAISMLMLTVNMLITPLTENFYASGSVICALGNLFYINETSCFPLLSWAIYPSIGILLGEILKKASDEKRENIMRSMLILSPVTFIAFLVFFYLLGLNLVNVIVSPINAYVTDLPNVVLMVSLALFLFAVCYYVCKRIAATRFMAFMHKVSTYIVPFYMLQWILVSFVVYGIGSFHPSPAGCMNVAWFSLAVILITGICLYVVQFHGMRSVKFLAKITSPKLRRKKRST